VIGAKARTLWRNFTNYPSSRCICCEPSIRLKPFSIALCLLALSDPVHAKLTATQQQAKEQGLILYNQYKPAIAELTIAAEAGDSEAQYFLAEEIRQEKRYITNEANKWYEAAATQGDLYAMLRLANTQHDLCEVMNNCPAGRKKPAEWLELFKKSAESKINTGDSEAMYLMYLSSGKIEWLEQSAEAGFSKGQWLLANRYKEGETFLLPWNRNNEVGRLLKASAEGGFPKGMIEYAAYIYENGEDLGIARHWIEEAAKTGYETAVSSYGAYLAHSATYYDFPLDLVKGYALTLLLKDLGNSGNVSAYVNDALPEIAGKMNQAQIKNAEDFADQWKKSHPPLSFFPEKLGF
jgi:TPR repeat protein